MSYSQTIERVEFSSVSGNSDNFQLVVGAPFGVSANGNGGSLTITSEYGESVFHDEMSQSIEDGHVPIADGISVYPNLADYVVNIVIGEAANLDGANTVDLFDMGGRLVITKPLNGIAGEISVDVSSLKVGTYLLKIGKATARMVKGN